MSKEIKAVYENGMFRPLQPVPLSEGSEVKVIIEELTKGDLTQDPAYNLDEIAEETGVTNLAANIDHYLYRLPER